MVRSLLYLQPVGEDYGALRAYFKEEQVLETAAQIRGFVTGELQEPIEPGGPALVTALWADADAYQAWLDSPLRNANPERAESAFRVLGTDSGGGTVYRVAHQVEVANGKGRL